MGGSAGVGPRDTLSGEADSIMEDLTVREGLSYVDAIRRAEDKAVEVAAPYREVAAYLRRELERHKTASNAR